MLCGQESKFGGGKVLRDGMGVNATEMRKDNPLVADTPSAGPVPPPNKVVIPLSNAACVKPGDK